MIAQRLTPLFDVKLIADGKQHFYQLGDDEVWKPGVTTALGMINKPALIPWAVKMCSENIKDALMKLTPGETLTEAGINAIVAEGKNIYKKKTQAAADIGTRAHAAINAIITNDRSLDYLNIADIKPCIDAFLDWKGRQSLTFEVGDTKLGSRLFGYGGSLDFVAFDGNKAILFDLKTSKGIYPEMAYQLAAYAQGFKETYGIEVADAFILRVGKETPDFEVKRVANMKDCLDGFLAALKLYTLSKWGKFAEPIAATQGAI